MKIKRKVIGYKEINTGKVDITDPCYDKDVWCRINGVNLQKGEYRLSAWYGAKLDEDDIDELSEDNGHAATEEEIRAEEKKDTKHDIFPGNPEKTPQFRFWFCTMGRNRNNRRRCRTCRHILE